MIVIIRQKEGTRASTNRNIMAELELGANLEGKMLLKNLTCCANCNKTSGPFEELKMCTDCRSVWYCTVDCQKAHRSSHKKHCKQAKTDIKRFKDELEETNPINVARDDDDDNLFDFSLPAMDDCPICFVPLPIRKSEVAYKVCCGQDMCLSCQDEYIRILNETNSERTRAGQPRLDSHCAYCGQLDPRSGEEVKKYTEKRVRENKNDAGAFLNASRMYMFGKYGVPKDPRRGFELCQKAIEIGTCNAEAHSILADCYQHGLGVQKDTTKARHYHVLAVNAGNSHSRYMLGYLEDERGNMALAIKHWLIAASIGGTHALRVIAVHYKLGVVSKEEYKSAILNHGKVHKACWSEQRERWKQASPIDNDESNIGF